MTIKGSSQRHSSCHVTTTYFTAKDTHYAMLRPPIRGYLVFRLYHKIVCDEPEVGDAISVYGSGLRLPRFARNDNKKGAMTKKKPCNDE